MALNKDISDLQNLGFSEYEATVYLKLVELGLVTSNPLISETGLHRSVVYTALDHLVARKVVEVREVKGKKTFAAVFPDLLIEEFDSKKVLAEEVAHRITEKMKIGRQEITIHQGNEEYLALLTSCLKSMPKGSTKYVLGTGGADFMKVTMLPIWKKYHKVVRNQGIKIKMVGYDLQKDEIEPYTSKEGMYEVKYLPSDMENPAGVHIYPEIGVVLNIIYSDKLNPVIAIKIKSKEFVRSNLHLFNNLWLKGS